MEDFFYKSLMSNNCMYGPSSLSGQQAIYMYKFVKIIIYFKLSFSCVCFPSYCKLMILK